MIVPTIGRIVWYTPTSAIVMRPMFAAKSEGDAFPVVIDPKQPFAAKIAFVHSNQLVNLTVSDHHGRTYAAECVPLEQDDSIHTGGHVARWMPYQVGQAKRHSENTEAVDRGVPLPSAPFPGGSIDVETLHYPNGAPKDIGT